MDPRAVASLSAKGWITDTQLKIDTMISHYMVSELSQSTLHRGQISSLTGAIQQGTDDIPGMREIIRATLENFLLSTFEHCEVQVTTNDDIENYPGRNITLNIYATVTDQGKDYNVAKSIEMVDGKVKRLIRLNNTGSLTG